MEPIEGRVVRHQGEDVPTPEQEKAARIFDVPEELIIDVIAFQEAMDTPLRQECHYER